MGLEPWARPDRQNYASSPGPGNLCPGNADDINELSGLEARNGDQIALLVLAAFV